MGLQPLQRDLIENLLGVQPRRKGLHIATKSEKTDKTITSALDDYTRREDKVLEGIRELTGVPATGQIVMALELKVTAVRRTVETAGREGAPEVIKQAYKDLEDIKEAARAAAKLAGANRDFYSLLEVSDREIAPLEDHAHRIIIEDRIPGIKQSLQKARTAAESGDFGSAKRELETAKSANQQAAEALNKFGIDLFLFNKAAKATEDGLTYLSGHPEKHVGAGDIDTAATQLAAARQDALGYDLPAARLKLATAEQARVNAKTAADSGVIVKIQGAKVSLDAVLNGADPAVAKAMATEIGKINAELTTVRSLVDTDIANVNKALAEAVQNTNLANSNRDLALVNITKLRADAKLTDAALKALDAHPQKAHANAEIQIAIARLGSAKSEIAKGQVAQAQILVTQAEVSAAAAKGFADKYAAFLVKYAEQVRFCNGLVKNFSGWLPNNVTDAKNALAVVQLAKDKANIQRKYTEAEGDLTNATQALRNRKDEFKAKSANQWDIKILALTDKLTTIVPAEQSKTSAHETLDPTAINNEHQKTLDQLKKVPIHGESLKNITAMKLAIEADADAGKWADARLKIELMICMVTAAEKLVTRRETYNTDRARTLTAIDGLKAYKSLLDRIMSLNNLMLRADRLATSEDMRFEDACEELADIRNTCKILVDIGKAADTYIKERAVVDTLLKELEDVA